MRNPRLACAEVRRQAGFTLVEMLVTLAVTAALLLGVLATFDLNSRVAKVQTNVSDMQQSLRIAQDDLVRLLRMAGRGGLPLAESPTFPLPQGVALTISDNVADNQFLVAGDDDTRILPGTDVVTVRGVFATLFQTNPAGALTLRLDGVGNPSGGTVTVMNVTPGGTNQDLAPLVAAIAAGNPEAILLVSTIGDEIHAVVALNPGASVSTATSVTLDFTISGAPLADAYGRLSTGASFPAALRNVAYVGILEEHRYYVREEHEIAGDRTSPLAPKLARARFYPGSNQPYGGNAGNARLDLADNILDLQVALAFDSQNAGARGDDPDNVGIDDQILETADGLNDDWLFNSSADRPEDAVWQGSPAPGPPAPAVQYLRITTLARTDRRDFQYQSPLLTALENHTYAVSDPANGDVARSYRRRSLRTLIDLRNL